MFRAFEGASPQERISWRIRATGSFAIAAAVRASAKSAGVTRLTRSSVHWAESNTAISSVKGSRCRSGIGGRG